MNDEDDDFIDLFEHGISYIEGGRTASGFYSVENMVCPRTSWKQQSSVQHDFYDKSKTRTSLTMCFCNIHLHVHYYEVEPASKM